MDVYVGNRRNLRGGKQAAKGSSHGRSRNVDTDTEQELVTLVEARYEEGETSGCSKSDAVAPSIAEAYGMTPPSNTPRKALATNSPSKLCTKALHNEMNPNPHTKSGK